MTEKQTGLVLGGGVGGLVAATELRKLPASAAATSTRSRRRS